MSRELKLVNRGLHDAVDPAFAPDGSLTKAVNCRYRPGGITLWQAEGRAQAGATGVSKGIVGVAWDPPLTPQLLFWNGSSYRLWNASTSEDDARFTTGTPLDNTAEFTTPGDLPWEVTAVPGGFFIFDGGPPKFLTNYYRLESLNFEARTLTKNISIAGMLAFGPKFSESGLPIIEENAQIRAQTIAGSSSLASGGGYWYWATLGLVGETLLANRYNGPGEGGTTVRTAKDDTITSLLNAMPVPFIAGTSASNGDVTVTIYIGTRLYDDDKWSHVHIYRNKDAAVTRNGTGIFDSVTPVFPNGVRIRSINKSSFVRAGNFYTATFLESSTSSLGDGSPYESVVVTVNGRTTGEAKNGELPRRVSCGDTFLDCLMINDLANPRLVRYSYPGDYQSFPFSLFFLTMNSSDADAVTAIRSLGQIAIVLTNTSCWRVNSLPTAAEFEFSHGEVQVLLAEATGCPRPQASTKAHLPAPYGTVCCWVSDRGIFATNGFDVTELTSHINWKGMNVKLDDCNLIDDPSNHRLVLHDGNGNLYYIHYHPANIIDGFLAVTGPILRPGGIKHLFRFYTEGGKPQVATLDNAGLLFYEGIGNKDESTGDAVSMEARTKEYYPGGIGSAGSVPKVLAHVAALPTLSGAYGILLEQGPDADHLEISVLEKVTRQLYVSSKNIFTESLLFIMAGSGSQDFGVNAVGWDWDDHGTT